LNQKKNELRGRSDLNFPPLKAGTPLESPPGNGGGKESKEKMYGLESTPRGGRKNAGTLLELYEMKKKRNRSKCQEFLSPAGANPTGRSKRSPARKESNDRVRTGMAARRNLLKEGDLKKRKENS